MMVMMTCLRLGLRYLKLIILLALHHQMSFSGFSLHIIKILMSIFHVVRIHLVLVTIADYGNITLFTLIVAMSFWRNLYVLTDGRIVHQILISDRAAIFLVFIDLIIRSWRVMIIILHLFIYNVGLVLLLGRSLRGLHWH